MRGRPSTIASTASRRTASRAARPLPARDDAVPHLGAQAAGFFDGRRLYAWLGAELGVTFGAQR